MNTKDVILELRTKKGLSQDELAEKVYVTRQAVSRWERGGTPDAELLPRLPRERTRVCGRDCRFPDFVLENVLRYAASLENT